VRSYRTRRRGDCTATFFRDDLSRLADKCAASAASRGRMAKLPKPLGAAGPLPLPQCDPPHRPAAGTLDAGTSSAVPARPPQPSGACERGCRGSACRPAACAPGSSAAPCRNHDGKTFERLAERLRAGREGIVAVGSPVTLWEHLAHWDGHSRGVWRPFTRPCIWLTPLEAAWVPSWVGRHPEAFAVPPPLALYGASSPHPSLT
jgi:hypothetical protein